MDELIATLRALVIYRKDPSTINDILRDYVTFEGKPVEVTKYGFTSIEELLEASGEFKVSKRKGEKYVKARKHESTAHIAKLVEKQKSTKRTRKVYASGVNVKPSKSYKKKKRESEIFWGSVPRSSRTGSSCDSFPSHPNSSFLDGWQPPFSRPQHFGGTSSQGSMPDSTFCSFHRSFPEPINNYSDLEIAVALEVYAAFRGVTPPRYHVYTVDAYRGYFCSVAIDNVHCSTEPSFYESPLQAKIECAYVALQIIQSNNMLRLYPVYDGCPKTLARKIAVELQLHGGGAPCHRIPQLFRSRNGETLPNNWLSVVKQSALFSMKESDSGDVVVLNKWL